MTKMSVLLFSRSEMHKTINHNMNVYFVFIKSSFVIRCRVKKRKILRLILFFPGLSDPIFTLKISSSIVYNFHCASTGSNRSIPQHQSVIIALVCSIRQSLRFGSIIPFSYSSLTIKPSVFDTD